MPVIPAPETIPAPAVTTTETVAKSPFPTIRWRESRALGVPHIGTLVDGVRLPQEGPDWVTWDPVRDRVPNRAVRLYGTDELVRMALDVIAAYRLAHPNASRVVVGDLSRRGGGEIDEHASHENGLDLDVYYPRTDGRELPPASVGQVDVRLAQDLLDRFVAAGASVVFVGYSVSLHGQAGVVVPYANHDNHMHVRIGAGGAVSGD
jgi:murein endopeptidase